MPGARALQRAWAQGVRRPGASASAESVDEGRSTARRAAVAALGAMAGSPLDPAEVLAHARASLWERALDVIRRSAVGNTRAALGGEGGFGSSLHF